MREIGENIDVEDEVKTENQDGLESGQDEETIYEVNERSYELNEGRLEKLSPDNLSYEEDAKINSPQNFSYNERVETNSPKKLFYENHTEVSSSSKEFEVNRNTYHVQPTVSRMFYPAQFDIFSPRKTSAQQGIRRKDEQICVENSQNECSCCCKKYTS